MKLRIPLLAITLLLAMLPISVSAATQPKDSSETIRTDILVIGSTPCGIASAIAAARQGEKVILADMNDFMGGMMTNGLGKTDIGPRPVSYTHLTLPTTPYV